MSREFMRLLIMFDLPTTTPEEKAIYRGFRKFLLKDGFFMLQYSVYVRICSGLDSVKTHEERIKNNMLPNGSVRALRITEKQFESMMVMLGEEIKDIDQNYEKQLVLDL